MLDKTSREGRSIWIPDRGHIVGGSRLRAEHKCRKRDQKHQGYLGHSESNLDDPEFALWEFRVVFLEFTKSSSGIPK